MKTSWIAPVAALVVGAAGGYISGKGSETPAETAARENSGQATRSATRSGSAAAAGESTRRSNRVGSTGDITRMPGNSTRVQALMDFYTGLTPDQLADEAAKLESLPMGERLMASFLLFGRWAEVDPTAAMAFSNTMGMAGGFVRPTILQSWASVDPANAAKYYMDNPREFAMMDMMGGGRGPMGGQGASSIIATEWARQDPAAAMQWASTLESGKGAAMNAVVGEVAKSDPRKAAEMIGSLDAADHPNAYRTVAAQYGALDFSEAQSWIRTLPSDQQAAALASAIGGLANNDANAAVAQVKLLPAGEAKDRLVGDIAGQLARKNPQEAADFIKGESEEAQRNAMRGLMPQWTSQNPAAALAFVNSYEPGRVRDSAAQSYVWGNNTSPPRELIRVAETITDESDRSRAVGVAAMRWMREDADGAKAYVESSASLSDDAKERIIEGRSMWGGDRGDRGNRGRGR